VVTVLAALIAVLGTLFGSVVTLYFQRKATDRAAVFASAERLRQDRLHAYNTFATAAIRCRQSEMDRWNRWREDSAGEPHRAARMESYRARDALREALLQVKLVTRDAELHNLGAVVIEHMVKVHDAQDMDAFVLRKAESSTALDGFIERAGADVQARIAPDGTLG